MESIFMSVCGEPTAHPCLMLSLYVCVLHYINLISSLVGYFFLASLPLFVCVCLPSLLNFSAGSPCHRFHNYRHHHHHHHQYDSSVFLLFEGSIFLSREGKETRTFYPPLVSIHGLKNENKNTSHIWCWREIIFFFFSFTFWIRVGGGNWRGAKNCFSVTERLWWQFITWGWKETLPTVLDKTFWPLILLCSFIDTCLCCQFFERRSSCWVCVVYPGGRLLNCYMILELSYCLLLLLPLLRTDP